MKSQNAEYTSCIAPANKDNSWVIKSDYIERDPKTKTINLKNARLNLYGIPVYYWPYISQPEPSVKRHAGWLTPYGGTKTTIGAYISNEYYHPLDNNASLSLIPTYSTKGGMTLQYIYTKYQVNQNFTFNVALTDKKDRSTDGLLNILWEKSNSKTGWKVGVQYQGSTNDSYTQEYIFLKQSKKEYWKSYLYAEKATKTSYMNITTSSYTDIRTKKSARHYLTPSMEYATQIQDKKNNLFVSNHLNLRSIQIKDKGKKDILSHTLSINKTFYTPEGIVIRPNISLRNDIHQDKTFMSIAGKNVTQKNTLLKSLPSVNITASYPLLIQRENELHLVEPVAGLFIIRNNSGTSQDKNYDSIGLELDTSNLFEHNRYAGLSKVENGKRFAYGVRIKSWLKNDTNLQGFLGQSIKLADNKAYSDYIGNLRLQRHDLIFTSNFELDQDEFKIRKLEANLLYTLKNTRFDIGLTETNPRPELSLNPLRQIKASVDYVLSKQWSISISNTSNYKHNSGVLKQSLGFAYTTKCGCITNKLTYTKDYSVNPNKPEESVYFNIQLLSFGEQNSLNDFTQTPKN